MPDHRKHPSSFRDPDSSVVWADGELRRVFSKRGADDMRRFMTTPAFVDAVAGGRLLDAEVVEDGHPEYPLVVRVPQLSSWTLPAEWTFSMLRDAALLHLDLLRAAMDHGFMIKDATAFNITFVGPRPVFVDHGSFVPWADGEPWGAYLQFCEHFLFPLLVRAYGGIDPQPWLRSSIRGIDAGTASRVLGWRATRRPGVGLHVRLNALLEKRYASRPLGAAPRIDRLPPAAVRTTVERVRRAVERTTWDQPSSPWSGYGGREHYEPDELAAKERFVEDALKGVRAGTVLDVGCNDGRFSDIVARQADVVVSIDTDHVTLDHLYRRLRERRQANVVPLLVDVLNPTPPSGWRSRERDGFFDRVRPDFVLLLAVLHHLAIGGGIPLDELAEWMRSLACPLVVEFPDEADTKVQQLVRHAKRGRVPEYSRARFEQAIAANRLFVRRQETLPSGTRTLFELSP